MLTLRRKTCSRVNSCLSLLTKVTINRLTPMTAQHSKNHTEHGLRIQWMRHCHKIPGSSLNSEIKFGCRTCVWQDSTIGQQIDLKEVAYIMRDVWRCRDGWHYLISHTREASKWNGRLTYTLKSKLTKLTDLCMTRLRGRSADRPIEESSCSSCTV